MIVEAVVDEVAHPILVQHVYSSSGDSPASHRGHRCLEHKSVFQCIEALDR